MRILILVALGLSAAPALAQQDDPSAMLRVAQAHLQAGQFEETVRVATPLTRDARLSRAERAEAWRVTGLALFQLRRLDEADAALFEYLKLEPDAHLDPNLHSGESVLFLEEVRARHSGELARYRPRPPRRQRTTIAKLLPPWGQFQNGQPTKGWVIGATELVLLSANVTSYLILRARCDPADGTCGDAGSARSWQTVNLVSGGLFLGVAAYGIIDAFVVGGRQEREEDRYPQVGFMPTDGGGMLTYSRVF